ncbi:MAG TPA: CopD family protein [Thermoplasmata archaeon]|nr:CopD family protein [Thermoplasmata archaeon]
MSLKGVLLVLIGLLTLSAVAGGASAHANYVSSNPGAGAILPQAPTNVTVTLSEQIQPGSESIRVTNSSGAEVDQGNTLISPTDAFTMSVSLQHIGPGIYTVTWNAVSAVDGHFTTGSFSFAVENPDGTLPGPLPSSTATSSGAPLSPLEIVLRDANFTSVVVAFGLAVFGLLVWEPAGKDLGDAEAGVHAKGRRELLLWDRLAYFALALATMVWLVDVWLTVRPASLGDVWASSFLVALLTETFLGAFAAVSLYLDRNAEGKPAGFSLKNPFLVPAVLGLFIIVAGSFDTHGAASTTLPFVGLLGEGFHLLAVAAWVGGLVAIVLVRRYLVDDAARSLGGGALRRFSRFAGYSVALILATGILLGVLLVGSWGALLGTGYGWVVLAKVSLFAPMVALGAYNRSHLREKEPGDPPEPSAVARVARTVKVEAVLGAIVLALAALLTSLSPAATVSAGPQTFLVASTTQGLTFDFSITPYPQTPGVYTFVVLVYNATTGADYNGVRNGTLTFTLTNTTLPPETVALLGPHGNHMYVISPALSRAGTWRIDLLVTRYSAFDVETSFYVVIASG